MEKISETTFRRKFSCNLYKSLRMTLCEMTFSDRVADSRGSMYPKTTEYGDFTEDFSGRSYRIYSQSKSYVSRLMGAHFPYSTYELTLKKLSENCGAGFYFDFGKSWVRLCAVRKNGSVNLEFALDGQTETVLEDSGLVCGDSLIATLHHGRFFDLYKRSHGIISRLCVITKEELSFTASREAAKCSVASVLLEAQNGEAEIDGVCEYIDCGVSQADIKPIKYEDGTPIIKDGKVWLTVSSRYENEMVQEVMSWKYDTCEFTLEGILLFDCGDGKLCGDVASSLIFDRKCGLWRIWMCCFSHGHILGHSEFKGDVRFGVNVVRVTPMEPCANADVKEFCGFEGDEDPDFYYDEKENKWYLAICRINETRNAYNYFLFSSYSPADGYSFVSRTSGTSTTGGSFVLYHGRRYFVCGANFDEKSRYDVYDSHDFSESEGLKFDFPDGGFRGWGSIFPVMSADEEKYKLITFDRVNAGDYNWSYGNIYGFEAD